MRGKRYSNNQNHTVTGDEFLEWLKGLPETIVVDYEISDRLKNLHTPSAHTILGNPIITDWENYDKGIPEPKMDFLPHVKEAFKKDGLQEFWLSGDGLQGGYYIKKTACRVIIRAVKTKKDT